ncbi:type II secretion system protein GspD [Neptuniibacter sp. QD37_11]|uniref:type II secretion system protein GspD n=1 Tax=Neptuniibacter sp. QD37_11 TaxID=3398209 RepID=UPI0039F52AB7
MILKKTVLGAALAAAMVLTGCSGNIPKVDTIETRQEITDKINNEWKAELPATSVRKLKRSIVLKGPTPIPEEILNTYVDTTFTDGVTLNHLSAFLNEIDIATIIPEEELRSTEIDISAYSGTLGDLLKAFAVNYDVSFNWNDGNILSIERNSSYMIQAIQNSDILDDLKETVTELGAEEVFASQIAGVITYKATGSAQKRISHFLERAVKNIATINIQTAIVTVGIDKNRNTGFDWGSLNAKMGALALKNDETASELGNSLSDIVAYGTLGSSALAFKALKGDFSFAGAINFLSNYGKTTTTQSLLLKTLSGKSVDINSNQKVPYTKSVGATSSDGAVTGSAEIEDVEVGLNFSIEPYFDHENELVTMDVSLDLSSLLGFTEVSAGSGLGTITRPNTQQQKLTSVVRTEAGESAIIGGLTFETVSDNRTSIAYVEDQKIANKNAKRSVNAMFILLRPTVVVYDFKEK